MLLTYVLLVLPVATLTQIQVPSVSALSETPGAQADALRDLTVQLYRDQTAKQKEHDALIRRNFILSCTSLVVAGCLAVLAILLIAYFVTKAQTKVYVRPVSTLPQRVRANSISNSSDYSSCYNYESPSNVASIPLTDIPAPRPSPYFQRPVTQQPKMLAKTVYVRRNSIGRPATISWPRPPNV